MPSWKESALFIEQQRLRSPAYYQHFKSFLEEITKAFQSRATKNQGSVPKVFISYAHPMPGTRHEDWTKLFTLSFRDSLKAAGTHVILDERDSAIGENTRAFMEREVAQCDSIIFVGTKTLYTKVTTEKEDGSNYAVHFEALHILKKCLVVDWKPIQELLTQNRLPEDLTSDGRDLAEELNQSYQDLPALKKTWISLKKKIKNYKQALTNSGITSLETPSPVLPIIISGLCGDNSTPTEEKAMPFFPGEMTIREYALNGTGETLHTSYLQHLIAILSRLYENHWGIEPTILEDVIKQKLSALEQTHPNMPLWTQGLSEDETKEYPPISGAWNHPEDRLIEIDNACQAMRGLAVKYGPNLEMLKRILVEKYITNAKVPLAFQKNKTETNGEYIHLSITTHSEQARAAAQRARERDNPQQTLLALEDILTKEDPRTHQIPKRVLITGVAGVGKTTCTRHMVNESMKGHLWQSKNFQWVFCIPLRELARRMHQTGRAYASIQEAILGLSFSEEALPLNLRTAFWNVLQSKKANVLLVLDGLDEIQPRMGEDDFCTLIIELMGWPNLIITGRPHAILPEGIHVEQHYELSGFNSKDIKDYVTHYFQVLEKPALAEKIIENINNNRIPSQILNVPIVLGLVCFVYSHAQEAQQNELTRTKLYQQCWEKLSIIYFKKYSTLLLDTERACIEQSDEILHFLGELAYNDLISDYALVFPGALVARSPNTPALRKAIQHGWLQVISSNENPDDLLLDVYDYEFPHLTFAEFCAAHYLVSKLRMNETETLLEIKELIKNQRFEIVLQFVSGIIADQYPKHLSKLLDTLLGQKQESLLSWLPAHSPDPETWTDEQLQLAIPCLQESGVNHPWFRDRNILGFIGETLHKKILSKEDQKKSATQLFSLLAHNPRISSKIQYEGRQGFNDIALAAAEIVTRHGRGSHAAAETINTIGGLGGTVGIDDQKRMQWLNLALLALKVKSPEENYVRDEMGMMIAYITDIIFPKFSSPDTFAAALERFISFFERENLSRYTEYHSRLFRQYAIHIKRLSDERINNLLTLAGTPKDTTSEASESIFAFINAARRDRPQLESVRLKLEALVHSPVLDIRFKLTRMLLNVSIEPAQDPWYLSSITTLSKDPERPVRRGFVKLLGTQTNLVARQWEPISQLLLPLTEENDVALCIEMLSTLLNFLNTPEIKKQESAVLFIIEAIGKMTHPDTIKHLFLNFKKILEATAFLGPEKQEEFLFEIMRKLISNPALREQTTLTDHEIIFKLEERTFEPKTFDCIYSFSEKYSGPLYRIRTIRTDKQITYHVEIVITNAMVTPVIIPKIIQRLNNSMARSDDNNTPEPVPTLQSQPAIPAPISVEPAQPDEPITNTIRHRPNHRCTLS